MPGQGLSCAIGGSCSPAGVSPCFCICPAMWGSDVRHWSNSAAAKWTICANGKSAYGCSWAQTCASTSSATSGSPPITARSMSEPGRQSHASRTTAPARRPAVPAIRTRRQERGDPAHLVRNQGLRSIDPEWRQPCGDVRFAFAGGMSLGGIVRQAMQPLAGTHERASGWTPDTQCAPCAGSGRYAQGAHTPHRPLPERAKRRV